MRRRQGEDYFHSVARGVYYVQRMFPVVSFFYLYYFPIQSQIYIFFVYLQRDVIRGLRRLDVGKPPRTEVDEGLEGSDEEGNTFGSQICGILCRCPPEGDQNLP